MLWYEYIYLNYIEKHNIKMYLITSDGDSAIPYSVLSKTQYINLIEKGCILEWYSLNVKYYPDLDDKYKIIKPIPIGIDYGVLNTMDYYGLRSMSYIKQEKKLEDILIKNEKTKKINKIFSDTHLDIRNNPIDRSLASDWMKKNTDIIYALENKVNKTLFWETMLQYKYVLSPLGNGIDCHRTWEALILKSIPIIKKTDISDVFNDLSVIQVKDYNEINAIDLNNYNLLHSPDKLLNNYWKNYIFKNKINKEHTYWNHNTIYSSNIYNHFNSSNNNTQIYLIYTYINDIINNYENIISTQKYMQLKESGYEVYYICEKIDLRKNVDIIYGIPSGILCILFDLSGNIFDNIFNYFYNENIFQIILEKDKKYSIHSSIQSNLHVQLNLITNDNYCTIDLSPGLYNKDIIIISNMLNLYKYAKDNNKIPIIIYDYEFRNVDIRVFKNIIKYFKIKYINKYDLHADTQIYITPIYIIINEMDYVNPCYTNYMNLNIPYHLIKYEYIVDISNYIFIYISIIHDLNDLKKYYKKCIEIIRDNGYTSKFIVLNQYKSEYLQKYLCDLCDLCGEKLEQFIFINEVVSLFDILYIMKNSLGGIFNGEYESVIGSYMWVDQNKLNESNKSNKLNQIYIPFGYAYHLLTINSPSCNVIEFNI